jgi:SAM-dependent methyltransferase
MNKDLLLLLFILLFIINYSTYDTSILNNSYNKKFKFDKFQYNYYNFINKMLISPRSSIKFCKILDEFNINSKDSILDIGSGEGFNLLYFNKYYKFKKIIGVEIDDIIYEISKNNVIISESNKINIYNMNVLDYKIPNDINYIYLFNPFRQDYIWRSTDEYDKYNNLISNIKQSYESKKREITIIFVNIDKKISDIFGKNFILYKKDKIYQFPNTISYAIFKIL